MSVLRLAAATLALSAMSGCATTALEDIPVFEADLGIIGEFNDEMGTNHMISADMWTKTDADGAVTKFHIARHDNIIMYVLAENDSANADSPGMWSRFDWIRDDMRTLYFCTVATDAKDVGTVYEMPNPDWDDLDAGCHSAAWTMVPDEVDMN